MTARPSRGALAALALALAALMASPGQAAVLADVRATAVTSDSAELTGTLAALAAFGDGSAPALLSLEAGRVDAVLEEERANGTAGQTGQDGNYDDLGPHAATFEAVRQGLARLDRAFDLHVLPLAGAAPPLVAPDAGCLALAHSGTPAVTPANHLVHPDIRDRHAERAATGAALEWGDSCNPSGWTVEGDFLIVLWDGDVAFDHAGGHQGYTTGTQVSDDTSVPGVTLQYPLKYQSTDRQLYLQVRGGRLSLGDADASVFLAAAEAKAATVHLEKATGRLPAGADALASGSDLVLSGAMALDLGAAAGGVAAKVHGRVDAMTLDGTAVALPDTGGPGPKLWMPVLLVGSAAAGGLAWRRGGVGRLLRAENLALAGRPADVERRTRPGRGRRHRGLEQEALALRIPALARLGRHAEALAAAEGLPPLEADLARAYVHALAGDAARCAAALARCAAADAGWAQAAVADPAFHAVRDTPAVRAALGRDAA